MLGNYECKSSDRGVSVDVIEVTVNSTDAPVIATDRGGVMSTTAADHTHDATGDMTLTLRHRYHFLQAWAEVEGADDNDAKIAAVVSGSAAANELNLVTKTAGALANLTAKTVKIIIWGSKAYRP